MIIDTDIAPGDLAWVARTAWFHPTLDTAAVARILSIAEGSVRQYTSKRQAPNNFPNPALRESGRTNLWTPDQIFRYVSASRRQIADRIPRLYCGSAIGRAQFLHAERRVVTRNRSQQGLGVSTMEFAVHHWLPADGRGPVAVAYPGPPTGDQVAHDYAALLLADLHAVTAVALVTDEVSIPHGHDGWQAVLAVAERGRPPYEELGVRGRVRDAAGQLVVAEWGWYELANLLRIDIPWWPLLLRDIDQMVGWFVGAPRHGLRPHTASIRASNLESLPSAVAQDDSAAIADIVIRLQRRLEGDGIVVLPHGDRERPGLVQAAQPIYRLANMPPMPTTDEIHGLLHCVVNDPSVADRAALALRAVPGISRVVADIVTIDPDHCGALARQWLRDLTRVDVVRAREFGYAYVRVQFGYPVVGYYVHPANPDMWIIETSNAHGERHFHATLATQVPANGALQEFELYGILAFFRDTVGEVWPMPAARIQVGHNSGYDGSGPEQLFTSVRILGEDAAADLATDHGQVPKTSDPLWEFIRRTDPPLTVTTAELRAMSPPAPPRAIAGAAR